MKNFDIDDPVHQQELNKASGRLGKSPAARLDWVLRLVQTDLDELSTGSRLDLAYEIYLFSNFGSSPIISGLVPLKGLKAPSSVQLWEDPANLSKYPRLLPTLETMKEIQLLASNSLFEIVFHGHWDINGFEIQHVRVGHAYGDKAETLLVGGLDTQLEKSFKLSLLLTLTAQGGRVRHCPGCRQYFRAGRRNQEFCSLKCQTRNATLAYRERRGLITGRPRGRPRKVEPKGKNQSKIKPSKTAKKGGSKSGTKTRKR